MLTLAARWKEGEGGEGCHRGDFRQPRTDGPANPEPIRTAFVTASTADLEWG